MSNQSTSGGLDKCSFCNKKDDEEPFLENDDHTACICQGCALMFADHVVDSPEENKSISKIKLEFSIQRAEINVDDIEDDDVKEKLDNVIALVKAKKNDDAVKALPTLTFEWSWSNGDADPSDYFVDTDDISLELNTQNSTLQVGVSNDSLVLTSSVFFELDIKEDVDPDDVQDWLDENSMVYCGFVAGGWSYNGDEGTSISVCLDSVESNSDIGKMSKVLFNVEFSNGDTYEKEKKSFEFMLPALFSESLAKVRNEKNQAELISFYKTIMAEDSPCYEKILNTFAHFGYRKLGWGDVMVDFDSIEIDGHLVEWGDELFDFRDELQIQLAPSDEGHMMYLCN